MSWVSVVDSHTAGEPTRVVVDGGPDLGSGALAERVERFRSTHDRFRSAVVNEPRGSDVLVGALLCPPTRSDCAAGVIFFNNVGYLGGCGHGTIGVVETLRYLGRIQPGVHRIETPVGVVAATLQDDGSVSLDNVASYRKVAGVELEVPGVGRVVGDVAWGGNWFFLTDSPVPEVEVGQVDRLTEVAWRIRQAVNSGGFPEVDHVELFTDRCGEGADSRSFVLCPGKAYDRSPCGTGTSAKLACLAAAGKLAEGTDWVQESVVGTRFVGRYRWLDRERGEIAPTIVGQAWVTGESRLRLAEEDPFCWGIRVEG